MAKDTLNSSQPKLLEQAGHAFRGCFLNECSRIEAWVCSAIASAPELNRDKPKKQPYLFGQKLKLATELAQQPVSPFCKPERVQKLLRQFESYAKLRSELAHAVMYDGSEANEPIMIFTLPAKMVGLPVAERRVFSQAELNGLLSELKKLAKEITDQKVTTPNPLSPPQPLRAAAAGP